MKYELKNETLKYFRDLPIGTFFQHNKNIYLKIS